MSVPEATLKRETPRHKAARWLLTLILAAQVCCVCGMAVIAGVYCVRLWHLELRLLWGTVVLTAVAAVYGLYRGLRYAIRHRFQFSMRLLLLATAALALFMGTLGNKLLDAWRIRQITSHGIQWEYLTNRGTTAKPNDPRESRLWVHVFSDEGLQQLAEHPVSLSEAEVLCLRGPRITDASTRCANDLAQLPKLTEVTLLETGMSDTGLVLFNKCEKLESLGIVKTPISDAGLLSLKQLHNLRSLYLRGTSVTPAGVEQLQKALPKCTIIVR